MIDKRIDTIPKAHSLCIWGCYGPEELPTRFSAVCKEKGHVVIQKDRYFDFIDVEDVKLEVDRCINNLSGKFVDLVYPERLKLSEWATKFGATFELLEEGLAEPYVHLEN